MSRSTKISKLLSNELTSTSSSNSNESYVSNLLAQSLYSDRKKDANKQLRAMGLKMYDQDIVNESNESPLYPPGRHNLGPSKPNELVAHSIVDGVEYPIYQNPTGAILTELEGSEVNFTVDLEDPRDAPHPVFVFDSTLEHDYVMQDVRRHHSKLGARKVFRGTGLVTNGVIEVTSSIDDYMITKPYGVNYYLNKYPDPSSAIDSLRIKESTNFMFDYDWINFSAYLQDYFVNLR